MQFISESSEHMYESWQQIFRVETIIVWSDNLNIINNDNQTPL